jgi:Ni/Co efflux regulator RcnB
MKFGLQKKAALTLAVIAVLGAGFMNPAQAEPRRQDHDRGQPHYHSKHQQNYNHRPVRIRDNDRKVIVQYITVDYGTHRKGRGHNKYRDHAHGHNKHRHNVHYYQPYTIGKRLPDTVQWRPIPRDLHARLKPVPVGYHYVQVDNDVLLMSEATKLVIDAITLLSAINGRG